ncbi:SanA/YdcF family protein [Sediminitomix flava]|uniref:SanA protein n=1 Tax=Sediminitomix flava TaxID=379075 RepID=A0A315ZBV7_SEDFL|nr:ElyC/SanA/YdcF family protein [Sediminitomix flava]PWJ43021.1 SanA protein [Sediminitomix flava]
MNKLWSRKILISTISVLVLIVGVITFSYFTIEFKAAPFIYKDVDALPKQEVGLILGTSKKLANGSSNPYFTNRIEAATKLFQEKKVKYLIVSGDNRTHYYNEPRDMYQALVKNGIPEDVIYMDYAGFRTLDSVIRCKEIFGQDSFIVISQPFHNKRAIYLSRQSGIQAYGYNAKDVSAQRGVKVQVREVFARVKALLDVYFEVEPKFLGDRIYIGEQREQDKSAIPTNEIAVKF